tara:strand:- start:6416 stop:7237 length:822 start_codon:yes stop_codon:yes gene_type:complete
MRNLLVLFTLVFFTFSSYHETIAYEVEGEKPRTNSNIYIGGGFINYPTYKGSSSRRFMWIPFAGFRYEDKTRTILNSFEITGPFAKLSLLDNDYISVGALGNYNFGRQNGDDNSLTLLEEIDPHFETGFEFEYKLPMNFSLGMGMMTGVEDFGDQIDSDFSLNYTKPIWITLNQLFLNKTSISYRYGNSDFMDEWFGTPNNQKYSLYKPDAGFYAWGIGNTVTSPVTDKISMLLNLKYDRLIGESADSPLVEKQGSPNQYSFMLVVMYRLWGF